MTNSFAWRRRAGEYFALAGTQMFYRADVGGRMGRQIRLSRQTGGDRTRDGHNAYRDCPVTWNIVVLADHQ